MATHSSLLLLENPMDKGAWWATVHMVEKSQTGLKQLCMHTRTHRKLKNLSLKIKISIIFPVLCVLCYMQSIFHIPFDLIFGILTGDVLSLKSHKWRPRKVTILPKVTWLMSKWVGIWIWVFLAPGCKLALDWYNLSWVSEAPLFLLLIWCRLRNLRRKQWHPTPVLLPGKSHEWRSLVGCSPWGH